MSDQNWFNTVAIALAATVVLAFLIGLGLGSNTGTPGPTAAPSAGPDHIYLTIAFNPATGMDQYFPANVSLPAHTLIIFTITNYDNGTNAVAPVYADTVGTVGGSDQVTYFGASSAESVSSVPMAQIGHTFTIAQAPYNLNVAIPASANLAEPTTVDFGAYFNTTGAYSWNCMAPCDPGSMMTPGLMAGIITVTG
ncbi:MAG: hypothetical protein L3K01_00620 [Thermoplasmata archaeon]|nr:hypothetical protein [Thermoplasmata archaeon]